jgi:hypothetical protein
MSDLERDGIGKQCGHPADVAEPGCKVCWLALHDPDYRRLYLGEGAGPPPGMRLAPPPARVGKCVHLGPATGETVACPSCRGRVELKLFACAVHGRATLARRVMGAACCAGCPDYREEGEDVARVELTRPEEPVRRPGLRWAYGVTTVPARVDDLLPRTLTSLAAAGFDRPRLFVDGARPDDVTRYMGSFGLDVTGHLPAVRVHGNWCLSMHELWIRHPDAERFALFQDDLLAVKNLRQYLERVPYPDGPVGIRTDRTPGYLNLYACPAEEKRNLPRGFSESNQNGRGALALVFSREALLTLLSARHLLERPADPVRGWRAVDGGIVDSMRKAGWREYVHSPSLVKHLGTVSTFDKRKDSLGLDPVYPEHRWPAYYEQTTFPGDSFDALDLLR